tara:strand:+ start:2325 stop:4412 length:2088 start_codon:yes stop_codon:yes gene_type:complete
MSFLVSMLTGYLNEDTEIMRSQAEYDREQEEKKRLLKESLNKEDRVFARELIKKNITTQDDFSKTYFKGVVDGKLKPNDQFSKVIAYNKERAKLGLSTVPVSKFVTLFDDAEKFGSTYGSLQFKNKSNGNADDATGFLAEASAFAQTDDFSIKLNNLKSTNKPAYLKFMEDIKRNEMTINNKLFDSDPSGTTSFDNSIFPGLKAINKFNMGSTATNIDIEQSAAKRIIMDGKQNNRPTYNAPFLLVTKGDQSGTTKTTPLNFDNQAQIDSGNKIGQLIGSDVNPYNDFVNVHIGKQPDLTMDDKTNIFKSAIIMDTTIPDIEGLDPDQSLYTLNGENANNIFEKIQKASFKNTKFGILALSPFMKGPTKAKEITSFGQKKVSTGVPKRRYLVSKVFKVDADYKPTDKISFSAIEKHRDNNQDVVDTFDMLESKVKEQPDNPALYTLFKQNLKAFISLDEGVAGGIVRDFLGQEEVSDISDNSSSNIGIKDELTSGYVDKMEDRLAKADGQRAREIEALKISLAFKMAKAADPSGRLSNQDVEAQYVKLGKITFVKADALKVIAQTKAEFVKQKDKFDLLIRYGSGDDYATERDYQVIDAAFAYDHLRKESERYNSFKNRVEEKEEIQSFDIGNIYKGNRSQNPSNAFAYTNPKTNIPESVYTAKGVDGKDVIQNGKKVYIINDGTIVDRTQLTAR